MTIRKITITLSLLANFIQTEAQQASLLLVAKYKPDGVWLRWAPPNAAYWQYGNRTGYILERFTLQPDGSMEEGSRVTLTPAPLNVYTSAQFDAVSKISEEAGALQELLYGDVPAASNTSNDLASIMQRNREQDNKHGIAMLLCDLSRQTATAAALFFIDKTARSGARYVYRVKFSQPRSEFNPGAVIITTYTVDATVPINGLKATFGDQKVTLRWPVRMHKGEYSAYYIERSDDGKKFTRVSDLPYVHMTRDHDDGTAYYLDSLTLNNKKEFYRIQGITVFAETGPYSNIVSGEGHDDLTGTLTIAQADIQPDGQVKIHWQFPPEMEKQIAGFVISQASSAQGPYQDISDKKFLPAAFRHHTLTPSSNNTYLTVRAVGPKGHEIVRSFPYLVQKTDEMPPSVPVNITGSVSKAGIVQLQWEPNSDNDLMGYRVFRTNSLTEEPTEVTTDFLQKPLFTDSLNINVLNKKIYYTVVAVDRNYNPSDYSPMLALHRPDVMPPAAPVITQTSSNQDTISLRWVNSISDDVAKHELVKIEKDANLSRTVLSWYPAKPLTVYHDQALMAGHTYQYKIIAYDSAGNARETRSREILYEPGYRDGVSMIKSSVDRETKSVALSWENKTPIIKCVVYRKINDGPLKVFTTLEGDVTQFSDRDILPNNTYVYKLQPLYAKGLTGSISKAVVISY